MSLYSPTKPSSTEWGLLGFPAIRRLVIGGRFARVTGELTRLEVPRSFCWGIMYIWLDSLSLLTLRKPFLHHHQVQFREGTIGYKMNVKPTLLGHVGSVSGSAVSVRLSPSVASGIAIIAGKSYRIGQVSSFCSDSTGLSRSLRNRGGGGCKYIASGVAGRSDSW